jgi:RNA polymerase sigma factor (sigma-70 family)
MGGGQEYLCRWIAKRKREREELYLQIYGDYGILLNQEEYCHHDAKELIDQLSHLSSDYRDVIVMYYMDGLSTVQISSEKSIPEGTVRRSLHYARTKFRERMVNIGNITKVKPIRLDVLTNSWGNPGEDP